jgi:hypothetical protein
MANRKRKSPDEYRALAYFRQSVIARWLGENNSVLPCLRCRIPGETDIEIASKADKAGYTNLQHCKRLWICPVCANKSARERRKQMQRAIEAMRARECELAFITYTLRHAIDDSCRDVQLALGVAHTRLHSGRGWKEIERAFDWQGSIRSIEITYGESGWHNHIHEIGFVGPDKSVSDLQGVLRSRWHDSLSAVGFSASNERGIVADNARDSVRDYVAKWGIVPELASGQDKQAKRGGMLPMQLPDLFLQTPGKEGYARRLFMEYASAMKGVKQVWASPSVRPYMAEPALTFEAGEDRLRTLHHLSIEQWRAVCFRGQRAKLLRAVELDQLKSFLDKLENVG